MAQASAEQLAREILAVLEAGKYIPQTMYKRALGIMGKLGMLGIADALRLDAQLTDHAFGDLLSVPYHEVELEALKETHILAAVFPMSILDIFESVRSKGRDSGRRLLFDTQPRWSNEERFVRLRGNQPRWVFIPKSPVMENGTVARKSWELWKSCLGGGGEGIPSARVLTYVMAAYFLKTGNHLFEGTHVFSRDTDSAENHVSVGAFGVTIEYRFWWGNRELAVAPTYR